MTRRKSKSPSDRIIIDHHTPRVSARRVYKTSALPSGNKRSMEIGVELEGEVIVEKSESNPNRFQQ